MGKLTIITLSFLFSLSLQARVDPKTGLDPEKDPNLKNGSLKTLQGMLPALNVTSGVCTDPNGCEEEKLVRAALQVETAFDKSNKVQQNNGSQDGSRPSTK